jgi:hypothetical protein
MTRFTPKQISIYSLLFAAVVSFLRISPFKDDSWDSAVLPIYESLKIESLLTRWFEDASMFEQLIQIRVFMEVAELIGAEYFEIRKYFLVIVTALIAERVSWMVMRLTNSANLALISGVISSLFPTWPLSASSVLDYYVLALYLGVVGSQLVALTERWTIFFFGISFIFFATGYAVMFALIPILVLLFTNTKIEPNFISSRLRLSLVFLAVFFKFAVTRIFFPSKSRFAEYNRFLELDSLQSWQTIVLGLKAYSSFLLLLSLLVVIPVLYLFIVKPLPAMEFVGWTSKERITMLYGSLLLPAAVLPYVIVGKSTSLFWIDFNTGRHAIPLLYVLPVLLAIISDRLSFLLKNFGRRSALPISISYIFIFVSILVPHQQSWNQRVNEANIRTEILEILVSNKFVPQNGVVGILLPSSFRYEANVFDSNLLVFRSTNTLSHFASISSNEANLRLDPPTPDELIMWNLPIKLKNTCWTTLTLKAKTLKERQKNTDTKLEIHSVENGC